MWLASDGDASLWLAGCGCAPNSSRGGEGARDSSYLISKSDEAYNLDARTSLGERMWTEEQLPGECNSTRGSAALGRVFFCLFVR